MDWLQDFLQWRMAQAQWRFLYDLIFLVPNLLLLHYMMFHTKMHYQHIQQFIEWWPVVFLLALLVGVTFYYS